MGVARGNKHDGLIEDATLTPPEKTAPEGCGQKKPGISERGFIRCIKMPGLRGVSHTALYFHESSEPTSAVSLTDSTPGALSLTATEVNGTKLHVANLFLSGKVTLMPTKALQLRRPCHYEADWNGCEGY